MSLDLNSLESVRKCAEELISSTKEVNILVNNAGVMAIPNKEVTEDGFEKQIGINHFGHFALTGQLFDHMKKSKNARVVNVASSAHQFSAIDRDDLMLDKKGAYQAWKAYGNSKLSNILFTKELAKKLYLKSDNTLTVVCCHPGDQIRANTLQGVISSISYLYIIYFCQLYINPNLALCLPNGQEYAEQNWDVTFSTLHRSLSLCQK